MKSYSTSHAFREVQMKATMRDYYTPNRMAKSKTLTTSHADEDLAQKELSIP